jgi:hypothetical protein
MLYAARALYLKNGFVDIYTKLGKNWQKRMERGFENVNPYMGMFIIIILKK